MTDKKGTAGRPPAKPMQTEQELIESLTTDKKEKPKLYKVQADEHRGDVLSELVRRSAEQLIAPEFNGVISLADTATVKAQTMKYLAACEKAGAFPSILGLARALGVSRRALYECMESRKHPDTADWLERCRDTFSDILNESALANNCNPVVSIFLGKALYGLRESVEIIARSADPLGEAASLEEIQRRTQKYIESLPEAYATGEG